MTAGEAVAGAVFAALADPTRREVLALVGRHAPVTATELARRLPVSRQAVTKHLDVLAGAGVVTSTREGREVRFSVAGRTLRDAAAWLADAGSRWDQRLAALERRAVARTRARRPDG